jgi:hypothetical protein
MSEGIVADRWENKVLAEADVPDRGHCHLAFVRGLRLPPRRGLDPKTGESLGVAKWDYAESDYAERDAWVIRMGLKNGLATLGCDCTHATSEAEGFLAWRNFLARHPSNDLLLANLADALFGWMQLA